MSSIADLKKIYKFNGDDVEQYLKENKDLIKVLLGAKEYIDRIFGADTKVELAVMTDEVDHWKSLFVVIRDNADSKSTIKKLDELDDTYFSNCLDVMDDRLICVTEPEEA